MAQFNRGRFSKEWQNLQEDHLIVIKQRTKYINGSTWTTTMIQTIWNLWFELWKMRNEDRHGKDEVSSAQAQREQALRELRLLYERRNEVPEQDHDLFETTLDQHATQTTHHIRQWINTYQPIILASIDRAARTDHND